MLKEAAIKYAKHGYSIFPLRPRTKEPLVVSWSPYRIAPASVEQVAEWWAKYPDANIALVTGQLNKIAVVDLDGPVGLASGQALKLQSPVQQVTGCGRQYLFAYNGENIKNAVKLYPGVDVRAEGGYIVAPPSIHPNGKRYQWLTLALGVGKLPPFPTSILTVTPAISGTTAPKSEDWIAQALQGLTEGNRNDTFFRVASRLRKDGHNFGTLLALLRPYAEQAQFAPSELELILRSVERYPPSPRGIHVDIQPSLTVKTWENAKEEYQKRQISADRVEFPTGFRRLDGLTGGFQRGEVTVIAARTGVGKTNVAIRVSRTIAESGKSVLFFSTEMAFNRIWDRYGADIKAHPLYICDEANPSVDGVRKLTQVTRPHAVVFDHINHVSEEYEGLSNYIHALKTLATEYNIPVIVTAQLSRAADQMDMRTGKKVSAGVHMIKGSGTIEQVAAHVVLLTEIGRDEQQIDIEAKLAKNRYGDCGTFYLKMLRNPWRLVAND